MKPSIKNFLLLFFSLAIFMVANHYIDHTHIAGGVMAAGLFPTIIGGRKSGYAKDRDWARQALSSFSGKNKLPATRGANNANPMHNAGGVVKNDWFSFGGPNSSFWDVVQNPANKYFPITIVNSDPTNTYNVLFTGGINETPGTTSLLLCDGVIPGTAGTVSASSQYNSINELTQYQYQNPTSLLGMKIQSNNSLQIGVTATYQPYEPYVPQLTSTIIPFINYTDEDDFKSAFLTLDLRPFNIEMGNQSTFTVPIVANSSTQFLIYLGPTVNSTHYLRSQFQSGVNKAVASGAKMSRMSGKRR